MDEDPAFQELWKEIGGNKIPEKKQINVSIPQQQTQKNTQKQEAMLAWTISSYHFFQQSK